MKRKTLLASILAIVMCFSLITGATFALFTSEDKVNIAVNSAKVEIIASVDLESVEYKTLNVTSWTKAANAQTTFDGLGGSAIVTATEATLDKVVPGDGLRFNIVVENESTVTVKYRTIISCENDNGLFAGLDVAVDDVSYDGTTVASKWEILSVGSADAIVPVVIELPADAGNDYQDKTCKISYKVEIVQGNADTVDSVFVDSKEALIDAIKSAPLYTDDTQTERAVTYIDLTQPLYEGNIDITKAALTTVGGDIVIRAAAGANPVIAGTVTIGYRQQNVGAETYNAKVTFDGITFDHAEAGKHCLNVQDVASFYMVNCTLIGDGEYGLSSPGSNATGESKIENCKFVNAGLQLAGKFAQNVVIDNCKFEDSCINVQGGGDYGPTIKNCEFDVTLTEAHDGEGFYVIRNSNAGANTKVENCDINVDLQGNVGTPNPTKGWGIFASKCTNAYTMTVTDVRITMTAAAAAETNLKIVNITNPAGSIVLNNVTVNGVVQ